jgi:exosome complex exonuclease DIS3/RRP44
VASIGLELNINTSKTLADSLDAAVKADDPYFNKLLRIMVTRCMKPAQYFCSGKLSVL